MILVDTNVWSEATRPSPDANVRAWAGVHADQLWLPTTVIGELLSGAALMPDGKRKVHFVEQYEAMISANADRIVDFDLAASRCYAGVLAFLERAGRNPKTADCQIAGIALARGMALATRNTKDFAGLGLQLINPWEA